MLIRNIGHSGNYNACHYSYHNIWLYTTKNYYKLGARTLGDRSRGSKNVTYRQQKRDKKVNTEPL